MMNFLNNKNVSLVCAGLNIVFAAQAWMSGNLFLFFLCLFFACYCGNNYKEANKNEWEDKNDWENLNY